MPIRSRENQYPGINAHLQDALLNIYAGWEEFHNSHVIHLAEFVDRLLPSRYIAVSQRSFQISLSGAEKWESWRKRQAEPDTAIYERKPAVTGGYIAGEAAAPTQTLSTADVFDPPEDYLTTVAIRVTDNSEIGQPVVWFELLSPSNKPPESGYGEYHAKRTAALMNGIVMVEMDYLHESRPALPKLPRYPQEGSVPYYIALTDPRPVFHESMVEIYGFGVDERIPKIRIPLLDEDRVTIDFGAIYDYTFQSLRRFSELVDYEQESVRFEHYSPADQERIRARMAAAAQKLSSST